MKILNKLKRSNGVRIGLCLAACVLGSGSRVARAEVELAETNGWKFTFDGRVGAFLSGGAGDDFPKPRAHLSGSMHPLFAPTHTVMGDNSGATNGVPDSGWPGNSGQQDVNNHYLNMRVRSGMYGNILGFGVARQVGESTVVRGYLSIWSTIESLAQDKWAPVVAEAREGYLTATGDWGMVRVGRMLGWLGRSSYEIDTVYGHGYGVGLPCTDALGPACGHIGTGVLHPGYSAGMSYATPNLGGLRLHVGIYDPVVFGSWAQAPFVRPEGALTFDAPIGATSRIKFGVEGMYQQLSRVENDPTTMLAARFNTTSWGVSGGLRLELGPLRLGLSGFRGKGIGIFYAMQNTQAIEDLTTHQLRTSTGVYGQLALVFGRLQVGGGFGMALVDQTPGDKLNATLSVLRYQRGISGVLNFHMTDSIVLDLDYFMFAAGWWGAPLVNVDATTTPPIVTNVGKIAGETQLLHFVSGGVTYHW